MTSLKSGLRIGEIEGGIGNVFKVGLWMKDPLQTLLEDDKDVALGAY